MSKKIIMTIYYAGADRWTYHEFYADGTYITQWCPEAENKTPEAEWRLTEAGVLQFRWDGQPWVSITQPQDRQVADELIAAIIENSLLQ